MVPHKALAAGTPRTPAIDAPTTPNVLTTVVHPDAAAALTAGRPVVALESTVITHGLPYPQNLALARALEACIKDAGAQPATLAILHGVPHIGITDAQLTQLAQPNPATAKASLWNLAAVCAHKKNAGTTVAATLHLAQRAGIAVFATGGIGGVHPAPAQPDASDTSPSSTSHNSISYSNARDVSADLPALARYRLVVVCAGPKSILDVEATVEYLETLGVPIVGYQSDNIAGFHTPHTPYPVTTRADTPAAIAQLYTMQTQLNLPQALLVSQPAYPGIDPGTLNTWLQHAHMAAAREQRTGKDLTPFLLEHLASLSKGQTVEVNQDLLKNNAILAAHIARAITSP